MKDFIYDCKCQNNDKKQIEEMYQEFLQYKHDTMCEVFSYKGMCENFINLGYRKINENEIVISKEEKQKLLKEMYEQGKFDAIAGLEKDGKVVISKEELDILKDIGSLKNKVQEALNINPIEELIQVERTACKETAEKIWFQASTIVNKTKHLVQGREYLHLDALKEIIKQFGVDLGEEK